MRYMPILAAIGLVAVSLACNSADPNAAIETNNMATVRYLHDEIAKGNFDVFDEILAENYVRHCQAMPPEFQELRDVGLFKTFVKEFYAGVSDYSETIDVMFADRDMVGYVLTMNGKHTGPMNGVPATDKAFTLVNIILQRFESGKIAESWVSWDNMAMLEQLGLFPPPPTEKP